jgi:hypothetical protein
MFTGLFANPYFGRRDKKSINVYHPITLTGLLSRKQLTRRVALDLSQIRHSPFLFQPTILPTGIRLHLLKT